MSHRPSRWASGCTALVALLGITLGVALTIKKFGMTFQPCLHPGGGCAPGLSGTCEVVLTSPLSVIGGLPLSIAATGFYLVVLVVSLGLFRSRRFLFDVAWPVLQLLALTSVVVSVVLATYSLAILDAWCHLCGGLYLVSAMYAALMLLERRSEASVAGWQTWRERKSSRGEAMYLAAVGLVVAVGMQSLAWSLATNIVDREAGCVPPKPQPQFPAAPIRLGEIDPQYTVVAVLDPSCHHCKSEALALKSLLESPAEGPSVAVEIHLFPRAPSVCVPESFPPELTTADAASHDACVAVLSTYCVASQDPEVGFRWLQALMGLQEFGGPWFSRARVRALATREGLNAEALDRCIDTQTQIHEQVRANTQALLDYGVKQVPQVSLLEHTKAGVSVIYSRDTEQSATQLRAVIGQAFRTRGEQSP